MEASYIKELTNEQIKEYQFLIQDQLSIDIPIIEDLKRKLTNLEAFKYRLQYSYRELDKELYLRTKDIITVEPKKKRKKRASKSDSKKLIDKLVKELGSAQVKHMLEQLDQSNL